jgi:hypothetical protein
MPPQGFESLPGSAEADLPGPVRISAAGRPFILSDAGSPLVGNDWRRTVACG